MEIVIGLVLFGIVGALILNEHQKAGTGFLVGCLLGPLGIVAAVYERMRLNKIAARRQAYDASVVAEADARRKAETERECPFCAEKILRKAKVCKHCRRDIPEEGAVA